MRKFENGLKVIGTDLGYGNIKTANTVMPTGLTIYDTEPIFQGNTLEYNGNYYSVGENHRNVYCKCLSCDRLTYYLGTHTT